MLARGERTINPGHIHLELFILTVFVARVVRVVRVVRARVVRPACDHIARRLRAAAHWDYGRTNNKTRMRHAMPRPAVPDRRNETGKPSHTRTLALTLA